MEHDGPVPSFSRVSHPPSRLVVRFLLFVAPLVCGVGYVCSGCTLDAESPRGSAGWPRLFLQGIVHCFSDVAEPHRDVELDALGPMDHRTCVAQGWSAYSLGWADGCDANARRRARNNPFYMAIDGCCRAVQRFTVPKRRVHRFKRCSSDI